MGRWRCASRSRTPPNALRRFDPSSSSSEAATESDSADDASSTSSESGESVIVQRRLHDCTLLVATSHLPAPQLLRVLKLYYAVASSQLPAPQIAPRTKVVLQSHQF